MDKADFAFLLANMFLAASLAGRVAAMYVGLFFGVLTLYYTFKGV